MSKHAALPARYDHVGSFLRPQYLLEARAQRARSEIAAEQLRSVEDQAIAEIVKAARSVGLWAPHEVVYGIKARLCVAVQRWNARVVLAGLRRSWEA